MLSYRPSFARFELNAGSALAGVLPASFQAAALGSFLVATVAVLAFLAEAPKFNLVEALSMVPGFLMIALMMTTVATVVCALHVALVGVPLAWLLGDRLSTNAGLALAITCAVSSALVVCALYGIWPFGSDETPGITAMVFAYALPAGLLYRRAVLNARSFNPYADSAA